MQKLSVYRLFRLCNQHQKKRPDVLTSHMLHYIMCTCPCFPLILESQTVLLYFHGGWMMHRSPLICTEMQINVPNVPVHQRVQYSVKCDILFNCIIKSTSGSQAHNSTDMHTSRSSEMEKITQDINAIQYLESIRDVAGRENKGILGPNSQCESPLRHQTPIA